MAEGGDAWRPARRHSARPLWLALGAAAATGAAAGAFLVVAGAATPAEAGRGLAALTPVEAGVAIAGAALACFAVAAAVVRLWRVIRAAAAGLPALTGRAQQASP